MSTDAATAGLPDVRPLHRLIRRTRRLLRSTWVATGAGLTAGLLLAALVLTTGLDLLTPLGTWLRLAALLLVVVPAAWAAFAGVVRPLFRRLREVQVARRIEATLPEIHNRLVSCIDLEKKGAASPTFHRRLLTEALERVRGFRPRMVLDLLSLRRAGGFALGGAAAFAVAWVLFPDRLPTAMARIFLPFADIPPASGVAYTVSPGDAEVLREEKVTFAAAVTRGEPDSLRVELRGDRGSDPRWFDLTPDRRDPSRWACTLDTVSLGAGFQNGFRYRVHGGGTWSREYAVTLVDRPAVVDVQTAVHFPAYMKIDATLPTPPQAKVVGPEGGEVEVVVAAEGQPAAGDVQLLAPGTRRVPPEEQAERAYVEDRPPVGASVEGFWNTQTAAQQTGHTEPPAVGLHGHWFQGDPTGQAVAAGDVLFAHVYLPAAHRPEAVVLEWHDGDGWEHRAVWGKGDAVRLGKPGTAAHRDAGALPAADRWVRLEVPAADVGLEGRTVRGMAFKTAGGQALWGRAGTVRLVEPTLVVAKSFPLALRADSRWAGRFPLTGAGQFRAELRDRAGHPNKPIKESDYEATADQPPQVVLERPGQDLVLSKPSAVPLTVSAFDDYGVESVDLLTRTRDSGEYERRTLRAFAKGEQGHSVGLVAALAEGAKLTPGGQLRFLVEARDRKGQTARTREFVLRVAGDANAADRQLEAFDRSQDPFRERLVQLIAEQKKVQANVEKLNKEYSALTEKLEAADRGRGTPEAPKVDPTTGRPKPQETSKLDPEAARRLAELQKELAKLAQDEGRNLENAKALDRDLGAAAEQANKLEMLPRPIADEMQAMQQTFRQVAVEAMNDLARRMNQGADPKAGTSAPAPDLKGLQQRGNRLGKELEGIKDRMDALAKARKALRDDLAKALDELRREMLNAQGELTARELEQLRDYIARLRERMKDLQGRQDDSERQAPADPARAAKTQADLDREMEKALADARNLLERARDRKNKRRPHFPDMPYDPEDDKAGPPREEDTDEPLPKKPDAGKSGEKDPKAAKKPDDKDDEEEKFMPALGGPKPKVDPRFAKKVRPVEKKPGEGGKEDAREDGRRDLDDAERALAADQSTLEQALRQLEAATRGGKPSPRKPNGGEGEPGLADLLRSEMMQQMMAMAGRMQQGPPTPGRPGQPQGPGQPGASPARVQGTRPPSAEDAELAKLDPATRSALMKLQPRLREELLQGMKEQGPEGYDGFIKDYFKRLTETKK